MQTLHTHEGREFLTTGPQGLSIEGVPAVAIARRYGTPVSVISLEQVRANLRRWRTVLTAAWPGGSTRVCPSFKANTNTTLWRLLADSGIGCDVFGAHELRAALEAGLRPEAISLNGTTKPSGLLASAIRHGVKITVDSLDELQRTVAQARLEKRTARVRLRLRPWLAGVPAGSDFSPDTPAYLAIHDYRPGVPEDEVRACITLAQAEPLIDLVGLHAHIGRQSTDLSLWTELGTWMADAVAASGPDSAISEVSFGGGYALPGDPTGQAARRRPAAPPSPEAYLRTMLGAFAEGLDGHGLTPGDLAVEIEPGRAVFGDAGVHLATVTHIKRQQAPVDRVFIETDTSEAFLADVVWESSRFDIVLADDPLRGADPEDTVAAVTGTSCGFDVLRGPEPCPLPEVGGVLAFLDTGAYQDSTASNFNLMGRPPLVLVDGDTCRLVRRRETYADVMARETDGPPERLP
jgi:diaminopimelate decarboxylase